MLLTTTTAVADSTAVTIRIAAGLSAATGLAIDAKVPLP
jgi:hypothetical protein